MLKPGPAKKITVYVGEDVHHHGEPLYLAVLNYLFYHGVSGCTVTKRVAGFGADHHLHTARILELSENLPIKIEFVEAQHDFRVVGGIEAKSFAYVLVFLGLEAVVRGRWKVVTSKETLQGLFTVVFKKTGDGWKIVHDHTSAG